MAKQSIGWAVSVILVRACHDGSFDIRQSLAVYYGLDEEAAVAAAKKGAGEDFPDAIQESAITAPIVANIGP